MLATFAVLLTTYTIMPIYEVNGKRYNIPADKQAQFEKDAMGTAKLISEDQPTPTTKSQPQQPVPSSVSPYMATPQATTEDRPVVDNSKWGLSIPTLNKKSDELWDDVYREVKSDRANKENKQLVTLNGKAHNPLRDIANQATRRYGSNTGNVMSYIDDEDKKVKVGNDKRGKTLEEHIEDDTLNYIHPENAKYREEQKKAIEEAMHTEAEAQKGTFWGTMAGDLVESLGSGAAGIAAGIAKASGRYNLPTQLARQAVKNGWTDSKAVKAFAVGSDYAAKPLTDYRDVLADRANRYGNMIDEETGEIRKKQYSDLWQEGDWGGAIGEAILTATASAPTSILAMIPGAGMALVGMSAAGSKLEELDSNPETKDMSELTKLVNAAVSGAIEAGTERFGAKIDKFAFEPVLKKIGAGTIKRTLARGGVGALTQMLGEGLEETMSAVGGNVTDWATKKASGMDASLGMSELMEGVQDAAVYGAAGGAQFGGATVGGSVYRASVMGVGKRRMARGDAEGQKIYGEKWEGIKNALNKMTMQERKGLVDAINTNPTEKNSELAKAANNDGSWANAVTNYVKGQDAQTSVEADNARIKAEQESLGRQLKREADQKRGALRDIYQAKVALEEQLGELANMTDEQFVDGIENGSLTTEQIEALNEYRIQQSVFEGAMKELDEQVQEMMSGEVELIDTIKREDGNVVRVNVSQDKNRPDYRYVKSGNVALHENGAIDTANSDDMLLVVDERGGNKVLMSPRQLTEVQQMDSEVAKNEVYQRLTEQYVVPLADFLEGKTARKVGEVVELMDDKGNATKETIVSEGENTFTLQDENGKTRTVAKEVVDEQEMRPRAGNYAVRDEVEIIDKNGQRRKADVVDIVDGKINLRVQGGTQEVSDMFIEVSPEQLDGMIAPAITEEQQQGATSGEQQQASALDGLFTEEEINTLVGADDTEVAQGQQHEQTTTEQAQQPQASEQTQQQTEAQREQEKQAFMDSLPKHEKGAKQGQINQSAMTDEQTLQYFEYTAGVDKTADNARKQVAVIDKQLEKAKAKQEEDPFNIEQANIVEALEARRSVFAGYIERANAQREEQIVAQQQEQQAQQEQARTGAVGENIKQRYDSAPKVEGARDVVTLANGERVSGRYVLVGADAITPSHDAQNGFRKNDGFPTNEAGNTVNDRDYQRDANAQAVVMQHAQAYDERAVQTPVVVSRDGVVISGNNRTMSGQLAAQQGTDGAYMQYIREHAQKYGFTEEQIDGMEHGRIVFVPDADMAYNTANFAKFNAEDKKTMNSLEKAVKASKTIRREDMIPIALTIDAFDKLSDFYSNDKAQREVVDTLVRKGVIGLNEVAQLMNGDSLSAEGRSFVESLMIGSVLNEDALRKVDNMPKVKQTLMRVMPQMLTNSTLATYNVQNELSNAVALLYEAKQTGSRVEIQLRQRNIFEADAKDIYDETEKLLAIIMDSARDTELRAIFEAYNTRAKELENGQADMFEGVLSKPQLLSQVLDFYGYGNVSKYGQQQQQTTNGQQHEQRPTEPTTTKERQTDGLDETRPAVASHERRSDEVGTEQGQVGENEREVGLSEEEAIALIAQMEEHAEVANDIELTPENWIELFGENGKVVTPIGEVKMGENQFAKLMRQGREGKLGMIKPTLENPHAIVEQESEAKEGDTTERASSYIFIRSFKKADGSRFYYFTSITVSKDGREVVVSSQEKSRNKILRLLQEGSVIWRTPKDATTSSAERQGLDYEQPNEAETATKGSGITPQSTSSDNKDTTISPTTNELGEKSAVPSVQEQIQAAEAEVNTNPTEAQKEAGNYKKGHVQIGTFNVTIEQPKGYVRSGVDADGKKWETEMQNTYGYIRGTEGVDGDHIDVFLSDNIDGWDGHKVFVVDQRNADGSFDEHKVMLGFNDINDAEAAYMSNYEEGWQGLGAITGVSIEEFEKWIASSHRKTKAFAEYKSVKTSEEQSASAETPTISQDSEQVGEQDAGPVNMETLQLNMSEEDFNALLNSGDKAAISEYLAEMDNALRIDESSPFAGQMALREEYNSAVQEYGKENIPAEVMADLEKRMKPYSDLSRAIYDRKYALGDKLRELESAAEKATAAKEKEIKVENKNTAFGGFLADKTDLGASTAEKALNKKYNFDGKMMAVAEFVENAVANGDAKLSTIEEPKYKGASRAAWNRMDAKQQEEDAKKVKESGTKTVYTVNDHDLGKTAYDYAKFLLEQKAEQEKVTEKEKESERVERIEDVGEKIGGAKKDKLRETIDRMKADMEQSDETLIDKIAKLPISKIFNFDFQKLREGGMPNEAISFMEIVKESISAKPRTSHKLRRWVNNTLALYKLCLEVGTNWDRVNTILTSRDFAGTDLKAQFDAYMSVGGFDSGLNIGNAKLKQLDKTAGYYKDGKFISSEGKWYVRDAGKHGGIYDTKEEAVEALKAFAGDNAGTTESGKKKEVKFAVYQRREDKSIFIAIKGKSDIVIQDGFKSAKEAFDYIESNNAELQSRYRNLLNKTNADFEENRERKGRDYRNGKDITAEEFRTTFSFRGVEFGNWMTQEDRRKAINECYDALMDLAAVCKVSPKALSLNGTLGMAFGSRGGGKFSAHYEPGKVVINLTKTRGAGTLAHEWFHAMDNYFAKMGETEFGYATGGEGMLPKGIQKYGKRYYDRNSSRVITEEEYNELAKEHAVRREMIDAWEHLMESLKNSDYYKRSNAYARLHNSKYWNDPTELGARAFSVWVENELSKQNTSNDYLANNPRYAKAEVTDAQDKYMPYPFDTDADWMDEAFGNLFEVMQERETEDGNVALYQRGSLSLDTDNPAFEAATKNTIEAVKKAGVEVVEATPEMVQAVLGGMQAEKQIIEATNERFNRELDAFKEKKHSGLLHLGTPMGVLSAAGVNAREITLSPTVLHQHLKKHNLTTDDLKGLAEAIQSPILVYRHGETRPNLVVVTELNVNGGKLSIALKLDANGKVVEVSNVSSVHSKDGVKELERLSSLDESKLRDYLRWVEKEKVSDWLGLPYEEERQDANPKLESVAKVIEEFENPKIETEFLRTEDGTIYGWAVNGKIFLTPEGMNPNTPAHEYTHLWASMIEKNDPKLWSRIVEVMKESPTWNEVLLDEDYRDIHNNDSRMAGEVLSRLSGEENYRRAMELAEREIKAADGIIEKAEKIALWGRIKQALADFWASVKGVFGFKDKAPWMEFVNMTLGDLYAGVNPNAESSPIERMTMGSRVDALYRSDDTKDRIETLFNQAISGEFKGKPISIGRLTDAGKAYLEQISGVAFKDKVDFVLNPSDLVHIYKGHFGNNETDERSIPLDIEDIRSIADVVSFPDRIIYAKENAGEKRKMFFFLKEVDNGAYNLLEIYADKKGNLTAKTFYKTKEGVSQRAITLSKSLHTTSETDGATLNDGAKIPQMFESTSVEDDFSAREGVGSYTDDELALESDPVSKALGKPRGTRKQRREFAQRERQRMVERVEKLAKKLHLDNVEVVTDASTLEGKKQRAKGFYSKSTGKITIVVPNNDSVADVEKTLLHEAVAHYGLRKLLGAQFDEFLNDVYSRSDVSIRKAIDNMAKAGNLSRSVATEEYLASLAENMDYDAMSGRAARFWNMVKNMFAQLLQRCGFSSGQIGDSELRYVLWRSYKNMSGKNTGIIGLAEDVVMQYRLGVGNYTRENTAGTKRMKQADRIPLLLRMIGVDSAHTAEMNAIVERAKADGTWMKAPNGKPTKLNEKQWAQVRTKAFKDWFGDWEKVARIEKLRKSKPIEIRGDEYKGKYELNRDSAKRFIKDNLRSEYTVKDTGETILLAKDGTQKVTSHSMGNEAHLKLIVAIPEMIDAAVFIDELPNEKDNNKYNSYRYYVVGLKIGGVDYTAKLTVGVDAYGNKYYDHSLTEIEKGKLINEVGALSPTLPSSNKSALSDVKDTKLISLLQNNSSKVVDENGEPMVVYHGTGKDFYTFRTNDEPKMPLYAGAGAYFTPYKERAEMFAGKGHIKEVFLDIRNPFNWDNILKSEFIGKYNTYIEIQNAMIESGYDAVIGGEYADYVAFKPSQIKSATDNVGDFDGANEDIRFRNVFGGNSGYVGYSMSKRAAKARDEGRYPKGDFRKEYQVTEKSMSALLWAGLIKNTEWHHTSMFGNRTTFYSWLEPWMSDAYLENKSAIDKLSREHKDGYIDKIQDLMNGSKALVAYNEELAEVERQEKADKQRDAMYKEYVAEQMGAIPTEFVTSDGVVVNTQGRRVTSEWTATKDGVRLTKRNGKEERNAAFDEVWAKIAPKMSFEEWLDARKDVKENNSDILFRTGEPINEGAREAYNSRIVNKGDKWTTWPGAKKHLTSGFRETWVDDMDSVRIAQEAITGKKEEDMNDWENAYMKQNHTASINMRQQLRYKEKFADPISKCVAAIFGTNLDAAGNYLNAKHGLERNANMRQDILDKQVKALKEVLAKKIAEAEQAGKPLSAEVIAKREQLIAKWAEKQREKLEGRDFSGLTALAEEAGMDGKDFTAYAEQLVDEVERKAGQEKIDALWSSINRATKWDLANHYNAGMMTKANYDKVRTMYKYYVPLRGFAETTSDELYDYLQHRTSNFSALMKAAKGRVSKADNPLVSMTIMANTGIMQANHNKMLQRFYAMVANNPNNLATISDVWLVKQGNDWVERFAEIPADATGDEAASIQEAFEQEMSSLEKQGLAMKSKNKLDLGVRMMPGQASEHAVRVKIGGEEKVIYINGNPRVAQALNGMLKESVKQMGDMERVSRLLLRYMAAAFTSRNPEFVVTNAGRDVAYGVVSAGIKYGPAYAATMFTNYKVAAQLLFNEKTGLAEVKDAQLKQYLEEFYAYGAPTGYTQMFSKDRYLENIQKSVDEMSGKKRNPLLRAAHGYLRFTESVNESVENATRLACYITSRQHGKSIERSVSDAKNITVNFNTSGSGGMGRGLFGSLYLFVNAAIQSLNNISGMAKNHPKRFTGAMSMFLAMGATVPLLNEFLLREFGDDDDKDAYRNIPEWTRRTNLVIFVPKSKGKFITYPLPHELRGMYGIGEISYSASRGWMRNENVVLEMAKQISGMLPLDPSEGGQAVVPDAVRPLWEVYTNKNFMGLPIYKDTPWNKSAPEWTKSYKGTSQWLVEGCKYINRLSGGDDVTAGTVDINPAMVQHVFRGYLGGMWGFYRDLGNISWDLLNGEDIEVKQVPFARKLVTVSDERTAEQRLKREYWDMKKWMTDFGGELNGYKKATTDMDVNMDNVRDLAKDMKIYLTLKKADDALRKLEEAGNKEAYMEQQKKMLDFYYEYVD